MIRVEGVKELRSSPEICPGMNVVTSSLTERLARDLTRRPFLEDFWKRRNENVFRSAVQHKKVNTLKL